MCSISGNEAFCAFVNEYVHPFGGLRFSNEYDVVPYLAQV
jgi:hypothetical protein